MVPYFPPRKMMICRSNFYGPSVLVDPALQLGRANTTNGETDFLPQKLHSNHRH